MTSKRRLLCSTDGLISVIERNTALALGLFLCAVLIPTQGYCADAAAMDTMTETTINTIFAPWIRKTLLGFGAGLGLFQSIAGGSFKPLLTWGGLGLVANYIPKLVEYLSAL